MKKELTDTGQIIKELRKSKGITQMELSEMMGVSYQQVQKYEKGIDNISVKRLKQIAKVLNVPVTLFFPSDREMVAETPGAYGKMADDEYLFLQLFRSIKDKKIKNAVLEFLGKIAKH